VAGPPSLDGVLETALYHDPGQAAEVRRFYEEVLGLRPVAAWEAGAAFRVGRGVCLLFDRELTASQRGTPPHAATGSGHLCFLAAEGDYQSWKERLAAAGVEVVDEATWDQGRSFYFHDPAGNLLEIAEADIWPR
jgi:catechol 2,3-dioxygenase-like lactoylglutathione lyase family enzyme